MTEKEQAKIDRLSALLSQMKAARRVQPEGKGAYWKPPTEKEIQLSRTLAAIRYAAWCGERVRVERVTEKRQEKKA